VGQQQLLMQQAVVFHFCMVRESARANHAHPFHRGICSHHRAASTACMMYQTQTMTVLGMMHWCLLFCFCFRNVHPSSRLLQAFAGSSRLPPGTLLISSWGVLLCSCSPAAAAAPGAAGSSAAAAAAAGPSGSLSVRKLELLQWQLQGVPLSCAAVPGGSSYVVGDDRAGKADGRSCAMHA
jgi:hypothetical protein